MKPVEVATIAVRLLGLLLLILVADRVAGAAVELALWAFGSPPRSPWWITGVTSGWSLGVFLVGLYMFLSGKWVIRRIVRGLGPPQEGICPACGYDLTGLRVSRCPECGEKLPKGVISAATASAGRSARRPPNAAS